MLKPLPLVLLLVATTTACSPPCTNSVLREAKSPDGRYRAITFTRACGATTGFSSQLSIVEGGAALGTSSGNALSIDDDHGKAIALGSGGPAIGIEWTSPRELTVHFDERARIFREDPNVAGITVIYVKDPSGRSSSASSMPR